VFALCIESSHARGMGHLFRALHLADALTAKGVRCKFLVNRHEPALEIIAQRGHAALAVDLHDLESGWEDALVRREGIRLWVNDRLDTSRRHARRIKALGLPLVTFDDRGEGAAWADLHIAALAFDDAESLAGRQVLRGVRYLILDPAIARYRRQRDSFRSLVVSLGGSDTYGVTVKVVKLLAAQDQGATIIIGPAFAHHEALARVMTPRFTLKRGVPSLAEEFERHDLAVTGGGITPFEASAAGLPCIVIANERFEIPVGRALERMGGAVFAGFHESIDPKVFVRDFPIAAMSRAAMANVDLEGVRRVTQAIMGLVGMT
jgi:spore coat polysaccharide biosynthesis predicted glycosyltransferase SpsG